MPEFLWVNGTNTVPALPRLPELHRLREFEQKIKSGKTSDLDPVVLVRHGLDDILTFDGNARTLLALRYGVPIPGQIYDLGETHRDRRGAIVFDDPTMLLVRSYRNWAIREGFVTFADLLRQLRS